MNDKNAAIEMIDDHVEVDYELDDATQVLADLAAAIGVAEADVLPPADAPAFPATRPATQQDP